MESEKVALDESPISAIRRSLLAVHRLQEYVQMAAFGFVSLPPGLELQIVLAENHALLQWVGLPDEDVSPAQRIVRSPDDLRDLKNKAERMLSEGLSPLWEQAVVMLWSYLDWMTADVVVELLKLQDPKSWPSKLLKVRIPAEDAFGKSTEELLRLLIDAASGPASGLELMKRRVSYASLSTTTKDYVARDLLELWAVRNVLAHRGGEIDERFVQRCPWRTDVAPGDKLVLGRQDFSRYSHAVSGFGCSLVNSYYVRQGREPRFPPYLEMVPTTDPSDH